VLEIGTLMTAVSVKVDSGTAAMWSSPAARAWRTKATHTFGAVDQERQSQEMTK